MFVERRVCNYWIVVLSSIKEVKWIIVIEVKGGNDENLNVKGKVMM